MKIEYSRGFAGNCITNGSVFGPTSRNLGGEPDWDPASGEVMFFSDIAAMQVEKDIKAFKSPMKLHENRKVDEFLSGKFFNVAGN